MSRLRWSSPSSAPIPVHSEPVVEPLNPNHMCGIDEDSILLKNQGELKNKQFADFYRQELLVDYQIESKDRVFRVHRIILAANSTYYRKLFSLNMRDDRGRSVLDEDVDPLVFEQMLAFMYFGEIQVPSDMLVQLLLMADRYSFVSLQDSCVRELMHRMDATNCLQIIAVGHRLNSVTLLQLAEEYARKHVHEIIINPFWVEIERETLLAIFQSDQAKVQSELDVLDSVITWTNHNLERAEVFFETLQSCVRFGIIPIYVFDTRVFPQLHKNPKCHDLLLNVYRYHSLGHLSDCLPTCMTTPRKRSLFLIGGLNEERKHPVLFFEDQNHRHESLCSAPEIVDDSGVCCWGGSLFVSGRQPDYQSAVVHQHDNKTLKWLPLPRLSIPRMLIGLYPLTDRILALGGSTTEHNPLNIVESLDPKTREWTEQPRMATAGANACCAIVDNTLYVVLVTKLLGEGAASHLQACKLDSGLWEDVCELPFRGDAFRMCAFRGNLCVVELSGTPLCAVKLFSVVRRHWTQLAPMTAEFSRNVLDLDGALSAVSQLATNGAVNVIRYDHWQNAWVSSRVLHVSESIRHVKWVVPW